MKITSLAASPVTVNVPADTVAVTAPNAAGVAAAAHATAVAPTMSRRTLDPAIMMLS
jgi:hypothetical protein